MSRQSGKGSYRIAVSGSAVTAWDLTAKQIQQFNRIALATGTYDLAESGAIDIRGGNLAGFKSPAVSSGYRLTRGRGGIVITRRNDENWSLRVTTADARGFRQKGRATKNTFAILDLADGTLVLVNTSGAWTLEPAQARTGGSGRAIQNNDPLLDLPQDFMP